MIIPSLRPATGVPALRQRYDKEERERAAYHESGHKTAALVIGFRTGAISIDNIGGGNAGPVLGYDYGPLRPAVETFLRGVVHASGPCSESYFCGDARGCQGDIANLRMAIDRMGQPEDYVALREAMCRKAELIVERHAKPIEKIAHELLREGQLSDSQVRRLMG